MLVRLTAILIIFAIMYGLYCLDVERMHQESVPICKEINVCEPPP